MTTSVPGAGAPQETKVTEARPDFRAAMTRSRPSVAHIVARSRRQPSGAPQQGDPSQDQRCRDLSHRQLSVEARGNDPRGAERRVGGRAPLLQPGVDGVDERGTDAGASVNSLTTRRAMDSDALWTTKRCPQGLGKRGRFPHCPQPLLLHTKVEEKPKRLSRRTRRLVHRTPLDRTLHATRLKPIPDPHSVNPSADGRVPVAGVFPQAPW